MTRRIIFSVEGYCTANGAFLMCITFFRAGGEFITNPVGFFMSGCRNGYGFKILLAYAALALLRPASVQVGAFIISQLPSV